MTASFVVTLNVSDTTPAALEVLADDILDDLVSSGHDVVTVNPWDRPSQAAPDLGLGPETTPPSLF